MRSEPVLTGEPGVAKRMRGLEEQRCRAMIGVDVPVLDQLLHDQLIWIHGSGRRDGKAGLLALLERDRPYRELAIGDYEVRDLGQVCISAGTVEIALAAPDAPPPYFNFFTNVWLLVGERSQLIHSQSTRCPAPASR